MDGYTKLYHSIIHSSVWQEPAFVKVVWITLLALRNQRGEVMASIPGLAHAAGVTLEECELALEKFLSPDKYSRTKTNDGRRLIAIDGGWELVNHEHYQNLLSDNHKKELATIRQQRRREKQRTDLAKKDNGAERDITGHVTLCHAVTRDSHACHDTETETEIKNSTPLPPSQGEQPKKRTRRTRSQMLDPFPTDLREATNRLLDAWPEARQDGSPVSNSPEASAQRIQDILTQHPEVSLEILEQAAMDYLASKPSYPNALQFFFGPGKPGKTAPYVAFVRKIRTVQQTENISQPGLDFGEIDLNPPSLAHNRLEAS